MSTAQIVSDSVSAHFPGLGAGPPQKAPGAERTAVCSPGALREAQIAKQNEPMAQTRVSTGVARP